MAVTRLHDEDFVRFSNSGQLGRQVMVAQYRVPRSTVLRLRPELPIAARVAWRTTISLQAEGDRTTHVADLGQPFPDPAWLPTDQKVACRFRVGGVVVAQGFQTYDATAGTVTANVTDQAGDLEIDVLMPKGALALAAFAPTGHAAMREQVLLTIDLGTAHYVDQHRKPFRVSHERYLLPDWGLKWYLRSYYEVGMDSPITTIYIDVDESTVDNLRAVLAERGLSYEAYERAVLAAWG